MLETRHHWLCVILAIYFPVVCFITYGIAVANKNVEPAWPYISDTGAIPPESCVFGQFLNIGAVIAGVIIYIRYRHIHHHLHDVPGKLGLLRFNTVTFFVGMATALGVSLVGNFQESNVLIVHLVGAGLAFFVGFIYCILQTVISYKTVDIPGVVNIPGNTVCIRRFRAALCVVDFCLIVIFGAMTLRARQRLGPDADVTTAKWTAEYPVAFSFPVPILCKLPLPVPFGYPEHVVATVAEWLVAFVSVIYFATFYTEFKHFRMRPAAVEYYKQPVTNGTQPNREIQGSSGEGQRLNANPAKTYEATGNTGEKRVDGPNTVTMETETGR